MKVAVAQLRPGLDKAQNIKTTVRTIESAAAQDVQLIVLPELATSPYQLRDADLCHWAEEIPASQTITVWSELCRKHNMNLVTGVLEQANGRYYNSAIHISPSGWQSCYRKIHLFGWERQRLSAGQQQPSVAQAGGAKIGSLVCYDLRFVELVRSVALNGIQLLCVPTTWTDVGKPEPFDKFGLPAAAHLALGHAYANKIFMLVAGRVGTEAGVGYLGSSLIAGPNGHLIAGPSDPDSEALLIADIDPSWADAKEIGTENHVFNDRRVDLY